MGGHRLLACDYVGPDVEDVEVREVASKRRRAILTGAIMKEFCSNAIQRRSCHSSTSIDEESAPKDQSVDNPGNSMSLEKPFPKSDESAQKKQNVNHATDSLQALTPLLPLAAAPTFHRSHGRHVSFFPSPPGEATAVNTEAPHSRFASPAPTETGDWTHSRAPTETHVDEPVQGTSRTHSPLPRINYFSRNTKQVIKIATSFLKGLLSPASISIIASIVIALVPTLKALFVAVPGGPHITPAPDGLPPLSILLDTATFMGAASVPIGLVCLGAALARLKLPGWREREQWARMPLGAIGALAVGKVVLMPVLGVIICEGLTSAGVIDSNDKVLRFVCM
jgi:auxin efflux carrier family protein